MKIKQQAVHSNGYRINYSHTNTSHTNTGYNVYNKSSHSNWNMHDPADTSTCWNWHGNSAAQNSYSKNHSNTGYTDSNVTETGRVSTNTTNASPVILNNYNKSGYRNSKSIVLDGSGMQISDDSSGTRGYRFYVQYCPTYNGTYSNWKLLASQSSNRYVLDASSTAPFSTSASGGYPSGWYKFAITVKDAPFDSNAASGSWSAIPNGNSWTYDHVETYTTSTGSNYETVAEDVIDTTNADTVSVYQTDPIRIYHYTVPASLNTDYYTKENMDETREEVNKVLTAMQNDQTGTIAMTFTPEIVSNFTNILWNETDQLRDGISAANNLRNGKEWPTSNAEWVNTGTHTTYPTTFNGYTDGKQINSQNIIDIQELLEILNRGEN